MFNIHQSANMRFSSNNFARMCCEQINMNLKRHVPLHHSDYLWLNAISVDEKQEHSNMGHWEAWQVEAGPDDQPPSLSVCPVTGGNVWKKKTGFLRRTCAVIAHD